MTGKIKWIVLSIVLSVMGSLLAVSVLAGPATGPFRVQKDGAMQAAAVGTGFTYQGKLEGGSGPVTADCSMDFRLYDDAGGGGSQVGSPIVTTVPITDGLFTVNLDFGTVFTGTALWLEVAVQCPGDTGFTTLSPRQALTPAPYALALPGLWTQQNGTSPNLVGGFWENGFDEGVVGATIGGGGHAGYPNRVTGEFGTVGGGGNNTASTNGTVSGGYENDASGDYGATIGGGIYNTASGCVATISGGIYNLATECNSTIGGGKDNTADAWAATIGGGITNTASGAYAVIGGGVTNTVNSGWATIGGGISNTITADAPEATIAGGYANVADAPDAAIGGGLNNSVGGLGATVGGGNANTASGFTAAIGGGNENTASGSSAAVAGGYNNVASGDDAAVGGGASNTSSGDFATVPGGASNTASGIYSTIGGGDSNTTSNIQTTVAGGYNNTASGDSAAVSGGTDNTASGDRATVGGGSLNLASGVRATVPGGWENTASGDLSFAAGYSATAAHDGSFVWGSGGVGTSSWGDNTFTVRAHGGARFYTASGTGTGVQLSAGGGSWGTLSDRNAKANFADVDAEQVLEVLAAMPIQTWNYNSQSPDMRHIGPVAQDFNGEFAYLFGEVESPTHINSMDAVGVALVSIQGLYAQNQELAAENANLQQQVDDLEARVAALESASAGGSAPSPVSYVSLLPWGAVLLVGGGVAWASRRRDGSSVPNGGGR